MDTIGLRCIAAIDELELILKLGTLGDIFKLLHCCLKVVLCISAICNGRIRLTWSSSRFRFDLFPLSRAKLLNILGLKLTIFWTISCFPAETRFALLYSTKVISKLIWNQDWTHCWFREISVFDVHQIFFLFQISST